MIFYYFFVVPICSRNKRQKKKHNFYKKSIIYYSIRTNLKLNICQEKCLILSFEMKLRETDRVLYSIYSYCADRKAKMKQFFQRFCFEMFRFEWRDLELQSQCHDSIFLELRHRHIKIDIQKFIKEFHFNEIMKSVRERERTFSIKNRNLAN